MKTQMLRTLCMGLTLLVGWSCTKERSCPNPGERSENAIAEARACYESTAAPLTKTVAGREVPIKPLPGTMAPLWDRAVAVVSSDGTSWVDVPIEAAITYTAVRGGLHDHEEGESCGHDHSPVQTVQKLSVYTAADGGQQLSVVTIVPEPDCTVDAAGFSSATGLAGFSGFASWHDLAGNLIRVAGYEQGTKTACVEATGDNRTEIGALVGNTILYPYKNNLTSSVVITKAGWCNICGKSSCKYPNDMNEHCLLCGQYDPKNRPWEKSECICARCSTCGRRVTDPSKGAVTCTCGNNFTPAVCKICGELVCIHLFNANKSDTPVPVHDPVTAHSAMFDEFFGPRYSSDLIRMMKLTDQMIDRDYRYQGNEYIHGMYVLEDGALQSAVRAEARAKMRNHFIRYVKGFVLSRDLSSLAEGLHPVLDSYVDIQTKTEILNYYSYLPPIQIVHGMNTSPYVHNPTPCMEALKYIYTELLNMNVSTSETELGALFDAWEKRAQGGLVDPFI
ncbi:hypothetical protein [uncultured Rikenella sp.]|uniref:hypothetical protein n=2 Tax=uncultured Rikenella sp. TaxID=368003 RepID=UPI002614D16E|nr:hypothetical protein [uncultured Rikenella sp.]